jgi:hypothetical protein
MTEETAMRQPLDPITTAGLHIMPSFKRKTLVISDEDGGLVRAIPLYDAPAFIAALQIMARDMGADIPDPRSIVERLCGHVRHSTTCTRITLGIECDCGAHQVVDEARAWLEATK